MSAVCRNKEVIYDDLQDADGAWLASKLASPTFPLNEADHLRIVPSIDGVGDKPAAECVAALLPS